MSFSGRVLWQTDSGWEGCRVKHCHAVSLRSNCNPETLSLCCDMLQTKTRPKYQSLWRLMWCCLFSASQNASNPWLPVILSLTILQILCWYAYRRTGERIISTVIYAFAHKAMALMDFNIFENLWRYSAETFEDEASSERQTEAGWWEAATIIVGLYCGHTLVLKSRLCPGFWWWYCS